MRQTVERTKGNRIAIAMTIGLVAMSGLAVGGTAHHHEHEPYVVTNEWNGFIECGAGTPVVSVAVCSVIDSPNDYFLETADLDHGIETVVIGMTWDPVGGISSADLRLVVDIGGIIVADVSGAPPLEVRLDMGENKTVDPQMRVFAPAPASIVYQQPFTVYHDHFYVEAAPDGYSALPDF